MLNNTTIMGRIVNDLEVRTAGERPVLSFRVAVQRNFKNKEGNYDTDFFNCVAWGNTATFIAKQFAKGKLILVQGELRNSSWTDKDGNKRTGVDILVDSVYFTGEPRTSGSASSAAPAESAEPAAPATTPGIASTEVSIDEFDSSFDEDF